VAEKEIAVLKMTLVWPHEGIPQAVGANQFAIQAGPGGEVFLLIGQVVPPIIAGEDEEKLAQTRKLEGSELPVQVLATYVMTPAILMQLYNLLQANVKRLGELSADVKIEDL
jgi:hypothetical protein